MVLFVNYINGGMGGARIDMIIDYRQNLGSRTYELYPLPNLVFLSFARQELLSGPPWALAQEHFGIFDWSVPP